MRGLISLDAESDLRVSPAVPDHVAAKARELYRTYRGHSTVAAQLIERLMDDRMQGVWKYVDRCDKQIDGKFAVKGIDKKAAEIGLLEFAFNLGRLTLALPGLIDPPDAPFSGLAKDIKDRADQLSGNDAASRAIRRRLYAEADAYAQITVAAYDPPKAIAREIAGWLRAVFGESMYGITATITNVILPPEYEISERRVRTWVKSPKF
jgi:hypothetical protein